MSLALEWQVARPGWRYEFPRDHHVHREFKTEWWYFTGNLATGDGRRFGYELTFFRQGVRREEGAPASERSRFIVDNIKFAHFTITDAAGRRFRFAEKMSRGAFGEAGFDAGDQLAWIDQWRLRMAPDGERFWLEAATAEMAISLQLVAAKPAAIHGQGGVSVKAADEGHASHYYSITRLSTDGELRVGEARFPIRGESWFDHEWATNQLAPGQAGWDWLSVQWQDGSELMLYRMRLKNGETDPSSSGTFIARDGTTTHLTAGQVQMTPTKTWTSGKTHARYPVAWYMRVEQLALEFDVNPVLDDQELALGALTYWEGAVDASGSRAGARFGGRGYLELTGYTGALPGLSR